MFGRKRKHLKGSIQCGSCGRPTNTVKLILKSPYDDSFHLCNKCLELMHELVDETWNNELGDRKNTAEQPPKLTDNMATVTEPAPFICRWCGQEIDLERNGITGPGFHICYECVCNLYHPTNTHATWKELNKKKKKFPR